jgi:hypothetical protein
MVSALGIRPDRPITSAVAAEKASTAHCSLNYESKHKWLTVAGMNRRRLKLVRDWACSLFAFGGIGGRQREIAARRNDIPPAPAPVSLSQFGRGVQIHRTRKVREFTPLTIQQAWNGWGVTIEERSRRREPGVEVSEGAARSGRKD